MVVIVVMVLVVVVVVVVVLVVVRAVQWWGSGDGTRARLSSMWPGFESWRRRHMWVEFVVGSLPCSERFFSGYSGFPSTLPNSNSNSICNARTGFNEFLRTPKRFVGEQIRKLQNYLVVVVVGSGSGGCSFSSTSGRWNSSCKIWQSMLS